MPEQTIAAISTANGSGGVAVIRLSGTEALSIAKKMFRPNGKTAVEAFSSYRMYPGTIQAERFADFGLCVYFKAPHSYTGEDVVEFHCHGGMEIAKGIVRQTFQLGARPAEAGEFTRRAFLNGKMSLSAAEGVVEMINARSESMIKAGFSLYKNDLGKKIEEIQKKLTTLIASIEVDIDYPEEDLEHSLPDLVHIKEELTALHGEVSTLFSSYDLIGRRVKEGVTVAIVGRPNTGKSSLLNAFLGYDKAIVSDIEGTTRDIVEGCIDIKGFQFHLYDTAGIRESRDAIERIGVEKAEKMMEEADVVLHVVDASVPLEESDILLDKAIDKTTRLLHLTIVNKSDLEMEEAVGRKDVEVLAEEHVWRGRLVLGVSAKKGCNIENIIQAMYDAIENSYNFDSQFIVEERHYRALKDAAALLGKAAASCGKIPMDMLTVDLSNAWRTLGEITGETANEDIITEIFSKFCVGK